MTDDTTRPGKWDAYSLYATIGMGAVGVGVTLFALIQRLAEVLPGRDVPVTVPVTGETTELPVGPDGVDIPATIDTATIVVPEPAAATGFALVADPIVTAATVIALIVALCLFCLSVARGAAFGRLSLLAMGGATTALAVGGILIWLFRTMSVNGAYSAISDYGYEGARFEIDFAWVFGVLALAAVTAAFQIGHRMRRDTEGLV